MYPMGLPIKTWWFSIGKFGEFSSDLPKICPKDLAFNAIFWRQGKQLLMAPSFALFNGAPEDEGGSEVNEK